MMMLDDVRLLFRNRHQYEYHIYLQKLLNHIHELQHQDGNFITEMCEDLREKIRYHAKTHSPIYNANIQISKADLDDKNKWYVPGWNASASHTGGSTNGERFHYLRWTDTYQKIEGDIHYKAILKEFEITSPRILYLMLDQYDDRSTDNLVRTYTTANVLISHGARQQANIHDVIKNKTYYNDYFTFYENLIEYLNNTEIDVILAPGNVIAELTWNLKRLNHTTKICKLLSSTGAKTYQDDLNYLKSNGNIDNWCDHMRCWDGGVTFFTCKHNVYHLLDGLAWATSEDGKLISDDYYSLPAPFVNYWNGDFATVGQDYKICKCGRSYREFKIDRTRSVAIRGVTNITIQKSLETVSDVLSTIKRVSHHNNFIRMFTKETLTSMDKKRIRQILPTFEVNFVVENG